MTATVFLALLAGHLLGDWVAQTDWQATTKTRSWPALAAHVTSYHLLMGTLLLLPVLRNGWPASNAPGPVRVGGHPCGHRPPLARAGTTARDRQPRLRHRRVGVIAADQALHLTILAILAVLPA